MCLVRKQIAGLCFVATVLLGRVSVAQDKIRLRNLTERCVLSLYSVETKSWQEPILLEKSAEVEIVLPSKENYCARFTFAEHGYRKDLVLNFHNAIKERNLLGHEIPQFFLETVIVESVVPVTTSLYKTMPTHVIKDKVKTVEERQVWHTEHSTRKEYMKFCYVSLLEKRNLWVLPNQQPILSGLPELNHDVLKLLK